jgi:hypothetical protein
MPRLARLTDALRHRGNALVFVGAAAALAGAGSAAAASAATVAQPGHQAVITDAAAAPSLGAADTGGAVSVGGQAGSPSLGAGTAGTPLAPADRAQQPAAPMAASHGSAQQAAAQQPAAPAARQAAAQPAQQAPRPQYSYQIYDSVTPHAIPANHVVATYATGNFAVPRSEVSADKAVVWIDTNGTDPHAAALDIEPGDMTPAQAPGWVQARLHYDPSGTAILYTMRSDWSQVQSAVRTLPHWMQAHIRWWIADPTGSPHMVPGANATQWYWGTNYDISTANPGF